MSVSARKAADWPSQVLRQTDRTCSDEFNAFNLFVKHLPASVDDEALLSLFAPYGEIVSAKIMVDPETLQSRGFGFVKFAEAESAQKATEAMHGKLMPPNKRLIVEPSLEGAHNSINMVPSSNLYIKHLAPTVTQEDLQSTLSAFGQIESCIVLKDLGTDVSKGVGLVRFKELTAANAAKESLHGSHFSNHHLPLDVRFAANSAKYRRVLRPTKPKKRSGFHPPSSKAEKRQNTFDQVDGGVNLFVFHLPENWNDSNLHQLFSKYGSIESAKVMVHLTGEQAGKSKGFGFVKFRQVEDGISAMKALNGKSINKKKLAVSLKKSE